MGWHVIRSHSICKLLLKACCFINVCNDYEYLYTQEYQANSFKSEEKFTFVLIVESSSDYVEIGQNISESIQERNHIVVRSVGNLLHRNNI